MEASDIACPQCRERFLRTHDAQGRYISHHPISYVKISYDGLPPGQPVLARSFADLRAAVLPLVEGTAFTVQLVAFMQMVGYGSYTRFGSGVTVLEEIGACQGLHIAMRESIPVEKSWHSCSWSDKDLVTRD